MLIKQKKFCSATIHQVPQDTKCDIQSCSFLSLADPLCTRYMEFVCKNRAQCLFQSLVCDGIKHCEDGSDEDAEYAGCGEKH